VRVDQLLLAGIGMTYVIGIGASATQIDRWLRAELPARWRAGWVVAPLTGALAVVWLAPYLALMVAEWRSGRPHPHDRTPSGVDALRAEEAPTERSGARDR
jgi:hypothetical protein